MKYFEMYISCIYKIFRHVLELLEVSQMAKCTQR